MNAQDLKIETRNLELTPELRRHIDRKLDTVRRHLPALTGGALAIAYEPTRAYRERILIQVTLQVNGGSLLRAEQRGPAAIAALNAAADSLNLAAARYKGRAYRSSRARHCTSLPRQQAADRDLLDRQLTQYPELETAA